jgi:hypothetical protein
MLHEQAPVNARRPNLFIVGQPRSGTTALYHFLKQHPQVFLSNRKEPEFFSKDLRSRFLPHRNEEHYLGLFKDCRDEKVVGEASTNYLYSEVAAKEIYHFNPSAKIIMMIREPVDFLLSYHSFQIRSSFEDENIHDFVQALESEPERKQGRIIPKRCLNPSLLYYSDRVRYSEQITRYYNVFNRDQVKIIVYDDFKKDNAKVYGEVLGFLGVSPDFEPEFKIINPSATVRFRRLKIIMDKDYLKIRRIAKLVLPEPVFSILKDAYDKTLLDTRCRPSLDPLVRKQLKQRYKKEVENVSALLNRDLIKLWGGYE